MITAQGKEQRPEPTLADAQAALRSSAMKESQQPSSMLEVYTGSEPMGRVTQPLRQDAIAPSNWVALSRPSARDTRTWTKPLFADV